jgi:hypothetical protein
MCLSYFLHQPHGWTIGYSFDSFVPARLLLGTEIRRSKNFLHAQDLYALVSSLFDKAKMLFEIQALDIIDRQISRRCVGALY